MPRDACYSLVSHHFSFPCLLVSHHCSAPLSQVEGEEQLLEFEYAETRRTSCQSILDSANLCVDGQRDDGRPYMRVNDIEMARLRVLAEQFAESDTVDTLLRVAELAQEVEESRRALVPERTEGPSRAAGKRPTTKAAGAPSKKASKTQEKGGPSAKRN